MKYRFTIILVLLFYIPAIGQTEKVREYFDSLSNSQNSNPVTLEFYDQESPDILQIILLRHGEPALDKTGKRTRKEAIKFVLDYDSVGIYPPDFQPVKLRPNELDKIYTSQLARSISTAEYLFKNQAPLNSRLIFNEFQRKIFGFPNISLPLNFWLVGSRILWFLGNNQQGIESASMAKKRAKDGARFLDVQAKSDGKVLLVSHGLLNHYLVKYLEKMGWKEVFDGGKGYFSQKVLIKSNE